jgi:hypothetical protein
MTFYYLVDLDFTIMIRFVYFLLKDAKFKNANLKEASGQSVGTK